MPPAQAALLAAAAARDALIPLSRMHPSMAKLPTQRDAALAFAEVQRLIERLEDLAGPGVLRALLERIRDGEDAPLAFERVAGTSLDSFWAAWKRGLRSRGAASGPPPLELAFRDPDAPSAAEDRDPSATREGRHERLGGLLRARGRPRAAAIEYEKAVAAARKHAGPFLLAKTARSHLEAGDAVRALARARQALEAYPDLAGPHVTAGEAALRLDDVAAARPHFVAALRVSPFDPRVHCGLAAVHERAGDAEAAGERELCRTLSGARD
jgi:tetratricopeptide (TPR) repeat protein